MKAFKTVLAAIAVASAVICTASGIEVSDGEITTGKWNSHYHAGRAYAEANDLPMILFWASPGCSMCEKLEKAVAEPDFVNWAASKQYVFIFVLGDGTPENADAKAFAKNSSRSFPYISVYWASKGIKSNFTGRSSTMPSHEGKTLQEKFMNSIEAVLGGTSGGGTVTPVTPDKPQIPDFWTRARTVDGVLYSESVPFAGTLSAKLGKANKTTGKAKVTVAVTMLGGTTKRLTGTVQVSDKAVTVSSTYGSITLEVTQFGYTGSLSCRDGVFEVESSSFGGLYEKCQLHFNLQNYPTEYLSNPVLTQYLPGKDSSFDFEASGKKWTFPAKGSVKWNRTANAFVATANPSGLKLTYSNKTGLFKGTYSTYVQTAPTKVKKISTKVIGYVYNGIGYGVATAKGLLPAYLQITR